jgi:hypothetical protein
MLRRICFMYYGIYMYVMELAYRVTTMVIVDLVIYLFIWNYTIDICI